MYVRYQIISFIRRVPLFEDSKQSIRVNFSKSIFVTLCAIKNVMISGVL